MVKKVLIIGSGVAGLTAARLLSASGLAVTVLDKGYKLGGRLASRAKQGYQFDHGTAGLAAPDGFDGAVDAAVLTRCSTGEAWYAQPEMRSLCRHLARGVSVTQSCEIDAVNVVGNGLACRLTDGSQTDTYDAVVCTVPAPQAAHVLAAFEDLVALAARAVYAPQWTAMLGFEAAFDGLPDCPKTATEHPVIGCLLAEHAKPGRPPLPALTLQADMDWSRENLELTPEQALAVMRQACAELLGATLPKPAYAAAHRWRYARAVKTAGAAHGAIATQVPVAVAGDWVSRPDVAGSLHSATAAAWLICDRLEI